MIRMVVSFFMFAVIALGDSKQDYKDYKCGKKKYCTQMQSCEEALFYLKKCNLKRLDRDRDGIPCEKICNNRAKR